ncbi:MAG: VWA domain-containing protein [Deltaproteobacteria bacterium]|nr:VWA domain-containing protein [Deltaproteobacteria bacterium]
MAKLSALLLLVAITACGPSNRSRPGGDDSHGDGGNNGNTVDAPACATSIVKADKIPLDLYVMLDQSSSMSDSVSGGGTKWSTVTSALGTFLQQPGLDGVSVGIQYFGVPHGGATCSSLSCQVDSDCGATACGPCVANVCVGFFGTSGDSCTASDYATAAVEIAPLPGAASPLVSSMGMHSPTTGTPTSAALQGAVDHAKAWKQAHPSDAVVAVLATDGDPSECDTSLPNIDAIAAAALAGTPSIMTFVIGVGPSLTSLNGIAAAGGTMQAFLVDTGGNVNQQFLDAMNAIRHAALGCVYQIPLPTDGAPDYNAVNVVYQPMGGNAQTFPRVMDMASCPANGNGWYYDNPANPTQIILCPASCTLVEADMTGEIDVTLGCATVIL